MPFTFAEQFFFDFWNRIKPKSNRETEKELFALKRVTRIPSDLTAQPAAEQLEFSFVKKSKDVQP
jgi:hypothetical protein